MYRRIELVGQGQGVFYSEAEGVGCHVSGISPDTALFLKPSGNGFSFKFSTSF
jgi:hypothetical protein